MRSPPVCSRMRRSGVNRAASCRQLNTSDRGITTKRWRRAICRNRLRRAEHGALPSAPGPGPFCPSPMSSARQPPNPNCSQEMQPAQSFALIRAQRPAKSRRADPRAQLPPKVRSSPRSCSNSSSQLTSGWEASRASSKTGLVAAEADVIRLGGAQAREHPVLLQPLLGQHAVSCRRRAGWCSRGASGPQADAGWRRGHRRTQPCRAVRTSRCRNEI